MTGLLQDAVASQIIETLNDEEAWTRRLHANPALLQSLAREALDEHRRGETRPLPAGWSNGFFTNVVGGWKGEPLRREDEGGFEIRSVS